MAKLTIREVAHSYELTAKISQKTTSSSHLPITLVFIHGWLLSRSYWQPLIDSLSPYYQCLSYDLRGFGDSAPQNHSGCGSCVSAQDYTLKAYGEDLKHLLQHLDIHHAWLVGHSLGGSIALWGAGLCPERIQGVICLNCGGGIYLKEDFEKFRAVGRKLLNNRFTWLAHLPFLDLLFARVLVEHPLDRHWGKQRIHDFLCADLQAALHSLLETTTEPEVHYLPQLVAQLQQPVYFVAGIQDQVMELKYVHHLASFHQSFDCEGKNVIKIDQCGHLAMLEQTATVAQNILSILEKHAS